MKKKLSEIFGIRDFRHNQEQIINNVLNKQDTLVIMPTGGGKSLTYQFPGYVMDGTTIVISPLISLMKDQVDNLNKKNIKSIFFNSSLSNEEKSKMYTEIEKGDIKFLYIAPERLEMLDFIDKIKKHLNINLIAVDEAHCISSWGHDFRESYLNLDSLKHTFKNTPVIALTATADILTRTDIINTFGINQESIFETPVIRDNLVYNIEKKVLGGFNQVEQIIKKNKGKKGIVYCFTRKDVSKLARELRAKKLSVKAYHAGLADSSKKLVMKQFMEDKIDVIVATIAFGMGVDKSDIRYIIHKDIPKNLESYYQETGRAGRDGKKSELYLLYNGRDITKMNWILNTSNRKTLDKNKFKVMKALAETSYCKKQIINWYFDNKTSETNCKKCSICNNENISKSKYTDFINFLNHILANEELYIDTVLENLKNKFSYTSNEIENLLWQLIFKNKVKFNKQNYSLSLNMPIKDLVLNDLVEIDYNYITTTKKKTKRKKAAISSTKKNSKKKITKKVNKVKKRKNTTKTKKELSDKQKAALAAGRAKAAANRAAKNGNKKKKVTNTKKTPFVEYKEEDKKGTGTTKKNKDTSRKNFLSPSHKPTSKKPKK